MLRRLFLYINQVWAVITVPVVFTVLVVPPTLLVLPFSVKFRLQVVGPFWRLTSRYIIRFACWSPLLEIDRRLPHQRTNPPRGLFIANHQSFMDIPLMLTQFQIAPIMKKEVLYLPIMGVMAWAAGAMIVSRRKRDSRKKVFVQAKRRLVEKQLAVQYYPEGTRNKVDSPKDYSELKVTLLHLAFEGNVPVYPISLYGTRGIIGSLGLIHTGKKVGILVKEAVLPEKFSDANSFARACWHEVVTGHQELKLALEN